MFSNSKRTLYHRRVNSSNNIIAEPRVIDIMPSNFENIGALLNLSKLNVMDRTKVTIEIALITSVD